MVLVGRSRGLAAPAAIALPPDHRYLRGSGSHGENPSPVFQSVCLLQTMIYPEGTTRDETVIR